MVSLNASTSTKVIQHGQRTSSVPLWTCSNWTWRRTTSKAWKCKAACQSAKTTRKFQSSPFQKSLWKVSIFWICILILPFVLGQCEVVYTLQKSQRYGDEDERTPFNVTKTVDFGKCIKTADVQYGYQPNPAEQLRCLNCLRQQKQQQGDMQEREQSRFGHCQQQCQPNKINEDKDVERWVKNVN